MTDRSPRVKGSVPSFFGGFGIEGYCRLGKGRISVDGAVGIYEIDPERIRIFSKREALEICGKGLTVSVFESGVVEIEGNITNIGFLFGGGSADNDDCR